MEAIDLRAWRAAHGWTQQRAAAELGVPYHTLRGWEGGRAPEHPALLRRAMKWLDIVHPPADTADAA